MRASRGLWMVAAFLLMAGAGGCRPDVEQIRERLVKNSNPEWVFGPVYEFSENGYSYVKFEADCNIEKYHYKFWCSYALSVNYLGVVIRSDAKDEIDPSLNAVAASMSIRENGECKNLEVKPGYDKRQGQFRSKAIELGHAMKIAMGR